HPGNESDPGPQLWNPLLSAELDFPTSTPPTTFYVVASTPRSGSTYLCHSLWSTGQMGAPLEYFNYHSHMLQMSAWLRAGGLGQYVSRLVACRPSPNGLFGFHSHWHQFVFVRLAQLLRLFPHLRFIYIERKDRLAQAVSYAKALQARQWASWQEA